MFIVIGGKMVRKRVMVTELDEGDIIIPDSNLYFLVRKSAVKTGKNSQRYMDLELDGINQVNGKVWISILKLAALSAEMLKY